MTKRTIHSKYLFQEKELPKNYFSPIIVAYCIRTPENIGNIIRLADNAGCEEVLFVIDNEEIRISKVKKTAASSFNSVKWSFCKEDELGVKIPKDYQWIAVETTSDSQNIYNIKLPKKVALFVGNEVAGINEEILDKCDKIVHIPMLGNNTSMNVSHALAVSLFEWQRQITSLE